MDDKRFDDPSRGLGAPFTRHGFIRLVSAVAVPGIAALWGRNLNAAKQGHRKKKNRRRAKSRAKQKNKQTRAPQSPISDSQGQLLETNTCPGDRTNAVCHCPAGLGGARCAISCVATSAGHDENNLFEFDCLCAGPIAGVPPCEPNRCPLFVSDNAACAGPTTCAGTCTTEGDCPFGSIPGCTCDTATGQCTQLTCEGSCDDQETCAAKGSDCACLGLSEKSPGTCGRCVPDALPANSRNECCSGDFCKKDRICGLCVPAG